MKKTCPPLTPELLCTNIKTSIEFYTDRQPNVVKQNDARKLDQRIAQVERPE